MNKERDLRNGPFVCVDKDGTEIMFESCPIRDVNGKGYWTLATTGDPRDNHIELPCGTIEKITGKKMQWGNKPIKI